MAGRPGAERFMMEPGRPATRGAGPVPISKDDNLAKPNYQYEKRQKDLAKKKKQEEKRQRKLNKGGAEPQENPAQPPADGNTTPE
jgi:hypothetical protein